MAFPTTVRRATAVSSTTNATTWAPSWTWGTNTAINSGEKVLWYCILSADGAPTVSETGADPWVKEEQVSSGTDVTSVIFTLETTAAYAASAAPAFAISSTASEQYSAVLLGFKVSAGKNVGLLAETSLGGVNGANTNPVAITNSSGAAQDVVVICTRSGDSTVVATAAPTNYGNLQIATAGGTGGASTNTAERQINIADSGTEDPGAFTSTAEQWASHTLGVYETAAGYSIAADIGSYALAGVAAQLLNGWLSAIPPGSYALTGTDAGLSRGRSLTAASGSYALSGSAAGLLRGYVLEAAGTNYIADKGFNNAGAWNVGGGWGVTGGKAVATASSGYLWQTGVPPSHGTYRVSFEITSYTSGSVYGYISSGETSDGQKSTVGVYSALVTSSGGSLEAGFRAFSFTGEIDNFTVASDNGNSYALTGTAATFSIGTTNTTIVAAPGAYALTGTATGLLHGWSLTASAGSYSLTGTSAGLRADRNIVAAIGAYNLSGTSASLSQGRLISLVPGAYALTGTAASLRFDRVLQTVSGSYSATGNVASLTVQTVPNFIRETGPPIALMTRDPAPPLVAF